MSNSPKEWGPGPEDSTDAGYLQRKARHALPTAVDELTFQNIARNTTNRWLNYYVTTPNTTTNYTFDIAT